MFHRNYYEPTEEELKAIDAGGFQCYVCGVNQQEPFPYQVDFLYKPHKRGFQTEQVCQQCYPDLVDGKTTTIFGSESYGYRGQYVFENNVEKFVPHSLQPDGSLLRIQDDEGYFCCETDIPLFRRWKVGGELKPYRW